MLAPAVGVGLDRRVPLDPDGVEERIPGSAVRLPQAADGDATWILSTTDGKLRILATAGGVERNAGQISRAGTIGRAFEWQHAELAKRDAMGLALVAQLDDPGAHTGCQQTTAKAANLAAPFEGLT